MAYLQTTQFQIPVHKAFLLLYSSIFNFTHTSNQKSAVAHSISGQLLMPVARSVLVGSFNLQNRTGACALSAGLSYALSHAKGGLGERCLSWTSAGTLLSTMWQHDLWASSLQLCALAPFGLLA